MNRVKDKVAIVTGAGSIGPGWGNGKAAAVLYAREGARVIAVDRNLEAAVETQEIIAGEGGACSAVAADVTDAEQIRALVERSMHEYSRIDILHNNVGIPLVGGINEVSDEAWDHQFEVN